jgi:hypothetical protein
MFRERLPRLENVNWIFGYIVIDELRAVLAKPDPVLSRCTLLGSQRPVVPRASRRCRGNVRRNADVHGLRGLIMGA